MKSSAAPDEGRTEKVGIVQDLRAVAVMLVVLVHATGLAHIRESRGVDASAGFFASHGSVGQFGACGVDLFFVISGFVMALLLSAERRTTRSEFLYKRFARIAPLFWLASLLFIALNWVAGRHIGERALLTSLTILPTRIFHYDWPTLFVGWSLAYELVFYGIVAIALKQSHPRAIAAATVGTLALASVQHPPPSGLLAIVANPIQLEFLWGMAVFGLWHTFSGSRHARPVGVTLMLIGGGLLAPQVCHLPFRTGYLLIISADTSIQRAIFWGLPWALVVLGAVLWEPKSAKSRSRGRSLLRLTGEASYSIYLVHLSVMFLGETSLPSNILPADMLVVCTFACACAAGIAAHIWVERPLLKALSRVKVRRTQPLLLTSPTS